MRTQSYTFNEWNPAMCPDSTSYRYSFNGKETDAETGTQDYGMRIYNPSLGKFLSVDPISKKYPELTPYQFASNTPIGAVDLDGLEQYVVTYYYDENNKLSKVSVFYVTGADNVAQDLNLTKPDGTDLTDQPVAVFENRNGKENFIGTETALDAGTNGAKNNQQANGDESRVVKDGKNLGPTEYANQIVIPRLGYKSKAGITGTAYRKEGNYSVTPGGSTPTKVFVADGLWTGVIKPGDDPTNEGICGSGIVHLKDHPGEVIHIGTNIAPADKTTIVKYLTKMGYNMDISDAPVKKGEKVDELKLTSGHEETINVKNPDKTTLTVVK